MVTYEKKNNVPVGIIIYALMFLNCMISSISYIVTIARGYATAYTWSYFVEDLILFFVIIAAFVIMLIRKRQSGFGVALPMLTTILSQTAFFIALAIQNATYYYRVHPNWTTYLTFLVIIPIIFVITYFFSPNTVLKILAVSTVAIALTVRLVSTSVEIVKAISGNYFGGMYAFSVFLGLTVAVSLYTLIIVQIFVSFKKTNAPAAANSYRTAGYVPVQPVAPVQVKTIPNEQILENFRALLEKGMITQEQFDEKKKELFGE